MGTTNGIEVGTGDTVLYVNESVQRNVWAYSLSSNGSISNKRLLIRFDDFGMDGMRCDKNGNLYIARYGKGTIAVVTPYGKLVKEISLKGQKPTNITFGGLDRKTCYVTMQDRGVIEKFSNDIAGRE
jgi:sugar lactone lactonase YvrE